MSDILTFSIIAVVSLAAGIYLVRKYYEGFGVRYSYFSDILGRSDIGLESGYFFVPPKETKIIERRLLKLLIWIDLGIFGAVLIGLFMKTALRLW